TTGCRPATQTTASPVTSARPCKSKWALSDEASAQAIGNQVVQVVARPAGLEPATLSLEGSGSTQLNYRRFADTHGARTCGRKSSSDRFMGKRAGIGRNAPADHSASSAIAR